MHTSESFAEHRPGVLVRFIDTRGLGSLIHADRTGIEITHVPVFRADIEAPEAVEQLEGRRLVTHVSRSNPLVKRIARVPRLTVEFLGPNSYISGDWNGLAPTVPTWNYMAVHLHGCACIFNDRDTLLAVLDRTAKIHEPRVGGTWRRRHEEQRLVADLLPGIMGVEITIESVEATFKLHQDRDSGDISRVVAALRATRDMGALAVADAMDAKGDGGGAES